MLIFWVTDDLVGGSLRIALPILGGLVFLFLIADSLSLKEGEIYYL